MLNKCFFYYWVLVNRTSLIDLNPVELKYYPFIFSLGECTRSCNILSSKTCVPKETKDTNVKAFDMTMKLRQWQNIIHVIVNANSIVQNVIQIKNGIKKHGDKNVKIIISAKKVIVGLLAHVFVRIANI